MKGYRERRPVASTIAALVCPELLKYIKTAIDNKTVYKNDSDISVGFSDL
jgi:hypothetical protein